MEYVVLDNFTPKSLQDRIEHLLMFSEQVTWQYRSQTGGVSDNNSLYIVEKHSNIVMTCMLTILVVPRARLLKQ